MSKSFNIVVLGPDGIRTKIGKTCLILRLVSNIFSDEYDPTPEDTYHTKRTIDDEEVTLNIYERIEDGEFCTITDRDKCIDIGDGFVCLYRITSDSDFQSIQSIRDRIFDRTENEHIPCILVGSHCDCTEDREVSTTAGQALANEFGWKFIETSAKTNINVVETFEEIVRSIREYRNKKMIEEKNVIVEEPMEKVTNPLSRLFNHFVTTITGVKEKTAHKELEEKEDVKKVAKERKASKKETVEKETSKKDVANKQNTEVNETIEKEAVEKEAAEREDSKNF